MGRSRRDRDAAGTEDIAIGRGLLSALLEILEDLGIHGHYLGHSVIVHVEDPAEALPQFFDIPLPRVLADRGLSKQVFCYKINVTFTSERCF
jgi:hypothetical protein